MKKFLSIILLCFFCIEGCAYSAPAIRLNEDGIFEVYDDKDLNADLQQQQPVVAKPAVIEPKQEQEVVITPEVQKITVEQQIVEQKTPQELEDEADYLKYQNYEKAPVIQRASTPKKEPSKIKKTGGKIMEGVGTCVVGAGILFGALVSTWWNSLDDEKEEEQESYCTKCKKYHKSHSDQH